MEFLNKLFTNIYDAINGLLNGWLGGLGLRPDAASAIVAGIMGLLHVQLLKQRGARIVMAEPNAQRQQMARSSARADRREWRRWQ